MWLSKWFDIFVVFSCFGWIYETIYCMIKWKKWENRGFLYGPLCPIYGTGVVGVMGVLKIFEALDCTYTWWMIFIICMLGSIVLEYGTHWTLEKLFHAVWWDYSYKKFNIHGRVCLAYSICFGIAGIVVTYLFAPITERISGCIPPILNELFALLFMLLIGMDIALTASALSEFENNVANADKALDEHMEQFVVNVESKYGQVSENMSARIAEEKERFSREKMAESMSRMSSLTKSAVKRVVSYRPGKGRNFITHNRFVQFMKNRKQDGQTKES